MNDAHMEKRSSSGGGEGSRGKQSTGITGLHMAPYGYWSSLVKLPCDVLPEDKACAAGGDAPAHGVGRV